MIDSIKPTDKIVAKVTMYPFDMTKAKMDILKKEIADKYGVPLKNVVLKRNAIKVDDNGEEVVSTATIVKNIQDPEFQKQLMKRVIELRKIEDVDMDMLFDIDNRVNSKVDFEQCPKYKTYKFKWVEWKNFLSYGENNKVDFSDKKGLIRLCGEPQNQSGKTTFARNLLHFALFGRSEKTPNNSSVFNKYADEATEVYVKVGLEVEGKNYVIKRTVTRPTLKKRTDSSKSGQSLEFYSADSEWNFAENCASESVQETNNKIQEIVGPMSDFNLIVSATAKTLTDLFSMGQTELGKVSSRWLGISSLEEKEVKAKEVYKAETKDFYSNTYNEEDLNKDIKRYTDAIDGNKKELVKIKEKLETQRGILEKYQKEKEEVSSKRKEVKEELIKVDISTIQNEIVKIVGDDETKGLIPTAQEKLQQQNAEWEKVKDITFNKDDLDKLRAEEKKLTSRNGEVKSEIRLIDKNVAHIKELIEQKVCPNCGHVVDVEQQGNNIAAEREKRQVLFDEGVNNKKRIDQIGEEVIKLETNREKETLKNRLKLSRVVLEKDIEGYNKELERLRQVIKDIQSNKENIDLNKEIDNKIRLINENIKVTEKIINDEDNGLLVTKKSLEKDNERYEGEIKTRQKLIEILKVEKKKLYNWEVYFKLVGKNGIVKIVLGEALPIINDEVARLLDGLVDFDVELSISEDNKICIDLVRDGKSLPIGIAASGFEETMASLAVRTALYTASSFAKPNMLVLDEIFGAIGSSHYDDIKELLMRIMKNYDFILDITHNELMNDCHDYTLKVIKENNISRIGWE